MSQSVPTAKHRELYEVPFAASRGPARAARSFLEFDGFPMVILPVRMLF